MSRLGGDNDPARLMRDRARARLALGDLRGATELLRLALTIDPDSALSHALLAMTLTGQKRLHAAEYEAKLALQLDPEMPAAHLALGQVGMGQRRFKEAEEHLRAALQLDPNQSIVHVVLARLLRLKGRRDDARRELESALALDPSDASTLAQLAEHDLAAGDLQSAERYAHAALSEEPESVDGLVAMGGVLLRRGDVEGARQHAVWALTRNATDSGALRLLSDIKARTSLSLGLWWRYNTWLGTLAGGRQILVLLGAFMVYRTATVAIQDLGAPQLADVVELAWLAIVVYTWVGPGLFKRSMAKELATIRLKPTF